MIASAVLCVQVFSFAQMARQGGSDQHSSGQRDSVSMSLVKSAIDEKAFSLCYDIRNGSDRDIWICESMDVGSAWDIEVYAGEDRETLFVQRRLDVRMNGSRNPPMGRYVRVAGGTVRRETLSFRLPVRHRVVLFGTRGLPAPEHVTRVVLEIGYYEGDLPATVFGMLDRAARTVPQEPRTLPAYGTGLAGAVGGPLMFSALNESVRARDEEILIPWTDQGLPGEKVVQMTVDDLRVPYSDEYVKQAPIHLSPCNRIEIRFTRSPLDFFFPLAQQQNLLSTGEKQYMQSLKQFLVEDRWDLMGIAYDASEAIEAAFFTERGAADLTCHRTNGSIVSLTVYDNDYILTQEGQVFNCREGLTRLRMLSPQIKSFDLRMQCAANLKNLWYRFRLYRIAQHAPADTGEFWKRYRSSGQVVPPSPSGNQEKAYPPAPHWCDALLRGYRVAYSGDDEAATTIQRCPSAGTGKCHYAMNLDCGPNSAANTVLLFEAQSGWNQHGGPELFTFDNHDPKGGLVLLNDGTVKFIRTQEELKQLRWK